MFHPEGTFTLARHVDFYECDLALRMRPSNLVRVLQQAGEDQLSSMGMNYHRLKDLHGMGFVTSRVILEIDRMPTAEENITIETSLYDVWAIFKANPYNAINNQRFLFLEKNEKGELIFVFSSELTESLTP